MAITQRYVEILGIAAPKPVVVEEVKILDLTQTSPLELSLEELREFSVITGEDEVTVELLVSWSQETLEYQRDDRSSGFVERDLAFIVDLANLDDSQIRKASDLLWEHCQICFECTDYGGGDESNENLFDIHNSKQAWEKAGPGLIRIDTEEDEKLQNRLLLLQFYPPWEDEHGCGLVLKNGDFIAWTESDPCLLSYDQEEPQSE